MALPRGKRVRITTPGRSPRTVTVVKDLSDTHVLIEADDLITHQGKRQMEIHKRRIVAADR